MLVRLALLDVDLVESSAQALGELLRVIIGPEVHEEKARLLIQHVAVQCGHLDAIVTQRFEDRIDLLSSQHKITGDRCLAAPGRLEVDR